MPHHRYSTRQRRPRVYCVACGRSIAVTRNKRTGEFYVRSHVDPRIPVPAKAGSHVRCPGSGRTLPSRTEVHYPAPEET